MAELFLELLQAISRACDSWPVTAVKVGLAEIYFIRVYRPWGAPWTPSQGGCGAATPKAGRSRGQSWLAVQELTWWDQCLCSDPTPPSAASVVSETSTSFQPVQEPGSRFACPGEHSGARCNSLFSENGSGKQLIMFTYLLSISSYYMLDLVLDPCKIAISWCQTGRLSDGTKSKN